MPHRFFSLLTGALLGSTFAAPHFARADDSSLSAAASAALNATSNALTQSAPTVAARSITQREFADAATTNVEFLKELRAWRDTLRGNGRKRDFNFAPRKGEKLALSLGQVAPAAFGGGAGVTAKWQRFEVGSTAQPQSLDDALAHFDSLLTGTDVKAQNPAQLNWIRAQLAASKKTQIEVAVARKTRETASASQWREGDFQSATARFSLPAKWSLSSDFTRAAVEREAVTADGDAANSWGFSASGPISHPFGVASASVNWRQNDAGYTAPTAENGAIGAGNGALQLAQDVKIGALSGSLRFGAATQRLNDAQSALAGQQLEQESAQSAAQMRFALTPNLSFTGNGQWNTTASTRALIDQKSAADALQNATLTPTQARDLSRQLAGDCGVTWNFSKALSVAVTLGTSSLDSHSESGDDSNVSAQNDETRRALEVRNKSGANDLRVRFSQRARKNALDTANLNQGADAPVSQWRIEAARPLIAGMRFKTILDFASDAAQSQSSRRIEGQLQLARAARLDARYRTGNLAPGLMSDEWSSVFAASSAADKQVSARFGIGSAAAGNGLGLSMEMVRSQGAAPDSYRVGVQFK